MFAAGRVVAGLAVAAALGFARRQSPFNGEGGDWFRSAAAGADLGWAGGQYHWRAFFLWTILYWSQYSRYGGSCQ